MSDEWKDGPGDSPEERMADAMEMANNAIQAGRVECIGGPRDGEFIEGAPAVRTWLASSGVGVYVVQWQRALHRKRPLHIKSARCT